jgi:hypothetical protein
MKTKKIVECEVIHIEQSTDSKPEKLRFDVVVKQLEISNYGGVESKKNVFSQLKSRIKLEKGVQVLTCDEGTNEKNGKTWLAVIETTKPAK